MNVSIPDLRRQHAARLEPALRAYLSEVLYLPLRDLLHREEPVLNGLRQFPAIEDALKSGAIAYTNGSFTGTFRAALGREMYELGARFDANRSAYLIVQDKLPFFLRNLIAQADADSIQAHREVQDLLTQIAINIPAAPTGIDIYDDTAEVIAAARIALEDHDPVDLTAEEDALRHEAQDGINEFLKDFTVSKANTLRAKVAASAAQGGSLAQLEAIIAADEGAAGRRIAGIAEHEVNDLTIKVIAEHAQALGSVGYTWKTCRDDLVRPGHKRLHNQVFPWTSPPVVDPSGRRCHPGQDYNCRCWAVPIL